MKKIRLVGVMLVTIALLAGCGKQEETTTKTTFTISASESEESTSEKPIESSIQETSQSQQQTDTSGATSSSDQPVTVEEYYIPTELGRMFQDQFAAWNIPVEFYQYDDSKHLDVNYNEGEMILAMAYNCYNNTETARVGFHNGVEYGEIYDVIDQVIEQSDSEKQVQVQLGHFRYDETSPVLPEIYLLYQKENDYVYLYGRGEEEVERVKLLISAMGLEISYS